MADQEQQSTTDAIRNRPSERVVISNPLTSRIVQQAKRVDSALRTVDDRYARGLIDSKAHAAILDQCRNLEESLASEVTRITSAARSNRRNNARRGKARPNQTAKAQKSTKSKAPAQPKTDIAAKSDAAADKGNDAPAEKSTDAAASSSTKVATTTATDSSRF